MCLKMVYIESTPPDTPVPQAFADTNLSAERFPVILIEWYFSILVEIDGIRYSDNW